MTYRTCAEVLWMKYPPLQTSSGSNHPTFHSKGPPPEFEGTSEAKEADTIAPEIGNRDGCLLQDIVPEMFM